MTDQAGESSPSYKNYSMDYKIFVSIAIEQHYVYYKSIVDIEFQISNVKTTDNKPEGMDVSFNLICQNVFSF